MTQTNDSELDKILKEFEDTMLVEEGIKHKETEIDIQYHAAVKWIKKSFAAGEANGIAKAEDVVRKLTRSEVLMDELAKLKNL